MLPEFRHNFPFTSLWAQIFLGGVMSVSTGSQNIAGASACRRVSAAAMLPVLIFPAALAALYYGLHTAQSLPRVWHYPGVPWICFWLALHTAVALAVAAMTLAGCLGTATPVEKVSFGVGPRLFTIHVAGVPVFFRPLFPGGYVKFSGPDSLEPMPPAWRRAAACLAGPAVLLIPGIVLDGLRVFPAIPAFWQVLWQGASNDTYGVELLRNFSSWVHLLPATPLLMTVFFGTAAVSLLPVPPLNGGQAYTFFVPDRWADRVFQVGLVIYFIAFFAWLRILAMAIMRHALNA
jgi:hypothetical protein